MLEVPARARHDSILSGLAAPPAPSHGIAKALVKRLKALPARAYFTAPLTVVLVGIGVNALVLQRNRHPAPLFAPASAPVRPAPAALPTEASHSANGARDGPAIASAPLPPPPRPPEAGVIASSRAPDPITELLRGEPRNEEPRLIFAAQSALLKLGYGVKADGRDGPATQQAIRDFERAQGLPLSPEITQRLVDKLTAAAHSGARLAR